MTPDPIPAPVAQLRVNTPQLSGPAPFPCRAVVPMPRGRHYELAGEQLAASPFSVRHGTNLYPTWWRPVTYWPDDSVRTAVVGCQLPFPNGYTEQSPVSLHELEGLPRTQVPKVSKRVEQLASSWSALALSVQVPTGETYLADLTLAPSLDGMPESAQVWSTSALAFEASTHALVRSLDPGNGKLAHAGGARAQLTYHAGFDVVELVLDWHQAIGDQAAGPKATLDHLHYLRADLVVPHGWRALSVWPEGAQALEPIDNVSAGRTLLSLVPELHENGHQVAHVHLQQHVRRWRLVLFREGHEATAQDVAGFKGWATCGPLDGWSYANRETPGTWALGIEGPQLEHVREACRQLERAEWTEWHTALATNTPLSNRYPGAVGPYHPYGSTYGGVTGGYRTTPLQGVRALVVGEACSFLLAALDEHTMLERTAGLLVNLHGKVDTLDELAGANAINYELHPNGGGYSRGTYWLSGKDPLGFKNPPAENRTEQVAEASYGAQLRAYGTQDHQHLRRLTGQLERMIILTGCPASVWLSRVVAGSVILSYHDTGNQAYGSDVGHMLANAVPQLPTAYGREGGHNLYAVAMARNTMRGAPLSLPAVADVQLLEVLERWLDASVQVYTTTQGTHGMPYEAVWAKCVQELGNRANVCQFYEACIVACGMAAASLDMDLSSEEGDRVHRFLARLGVGLARWFRPGDVAPFYNAGVAPWQSTDPAERWLSPADQPEPIVSAYADDFYPPAALALACRAVVRLAHAGQPVASWPAELAAALAAFTEAPDGADLLAHAKGWMVSQGLRNVETWGALLSVLQHDPLEVQA